jgi:hypothetical protein
MKIKTITPALLCSFLTTVLTSTSLMANEPVCDLVSKCIPAPVCPPETYAYAPGTFSIKPINFNFGSFAFGFKHQDSQLSSLTSQPVSTIKTDAFKRPVNFGFAESDRNGVGYAFELGYVIKNDWEFFARAGYCREAGNGAFHFGINTIKFQDRDNYGFSFGPRKYFDFQSPWKPFVQAAAGLTIQGDTKANIAWHNPAGFGIATDIYIREYKLAKQSTLFNFELGLGTDYTFTDYFALSLSVALRYNQRGGGSTVAIPGNNTSFLFPVPPTTLTYRDNKQHWYVPITLSLKFMF